MLFPRAWARAFSAVALTWAPAPGGDEAHDTDTDVEGLSFAAQTGRRMLRGRRRMADDDFRRTLALSMIMLSPFHWLMAALFEASEQKVKDSTVSDVVGSVNMCSVRYIDLMQADVEDSRSQWGIARNTTCGTPLPDRAYMRREMLRMIGGFHMRLVAPLTSDDMVPLFDMLENGASDEAILHKASRLQRKRCCIGHSSHLFRESTKKSSVGRLRRVKMTWVPSILNTERDHRGNIIRQRFAYYGPTRRWRHQVPLYICRRSTDRWVNGDKQRGNVCVCVCVC